MLFLDTACNIIDKCCRFRYTKNLYSHEHVSASLGNGRVSRVIGRGSRVISRGSRVYRSRVKSRGRGSKVEVEGQKSRVESRKY
jgi:hypothetical protein